MDRERIDDGCGHCARARGRWSGAGRSMARVRTTSRGNRLIFDTMLPPAPRALGRRSDARRSARGAVGNRELWGTGRRPLRHEGCCRGPARAAIAAYALARS
ncbi:hypothetical protein A7982_13700 [Minicystis rosea]|nr:hypothetical protein A7982_13700 [Minicystis rosea]